MTKLNEAIDEKIDNVLDEMLGISVLIEDSQNNWVEDLVFNDRTMGTDIVKMQLPSSVPYSFTHQRTTGSAQTGLKITTTKYSGSVPKAMFKKENPKNIFKIFVRNNSPVIYVNDVLSAKQPEVNGNGSTGSEVNGNGSTGSESEIIKIRVEGEIGGKSLVSFNLPKNAKTLTITTTELTNADRNMADVFVSRGSVPTVTSPYPYVYSAQYKHITGNRGAKVITISNAQAGDWNVLLYGFNSYYWSWVIVTVKY